MWWSATRPSKRSTAASASSKMHNGRERGWPSSEREYPATPPKADGNSHSRASASCSHQHRRDPVRERRRARFQRRIVDTTLALPLQRAAAEMPTAARHSWRRGAVPAIASGWSLAFVLSIEFAALAEPPGEPETPTGVVLAIDGQDLVIDLGTDRGVAPGDVVEIWRPLRFKHPTTGKLVSDRFRIGSLELKQVRKAMSLARASGALERDPEKGDIVVPTSQPANQPVARPTRPPKAPPGPTATEPNASPDEPEAARVAALVENL